tara:strand:- start:78 stop:332 length:255 start_codon:yes stop_codon:yes gene_type:complete
MAKFDIVVSKRENFKGYKGNPPTNKTEYDSMKTEMFEGTAPTWTQIKNEMDVTLTPKELKANAKTKLVNGEKLSEEEAKALCGV